MTIQNLTSVAVYVLALLGCISIVRRFWLASGEFWKGATNVSPDIYVPLIVVVLTAFFGFGATFIGQRLNKQQETDNAFREKKVKIYLDFLRIFETAQRSTKPELSSTPLDTNDLASKLVEFRTEAILWASPEVLLALDDFTKLKVRTHIDIFDVLETLQREMRRDLGLSNRNLGENFFAKLSLSDPDDLERARKITASS